MNDQRLLSLTALVLLLMALLLPWPIGGIGRAEPAIAFAVIASLASLLFAWLGRSDSLGRLVLKLAGGLATIAVPLIAVVWFSFERSVAANRDRVRAQAAQAEALKAQLVQVTQPDGHSTVFQMPVPQTTAPRVASGPDPMPIVTWPAPPAAVPPVATMMQQPPQGGPMMRPMPADAPTLDAVAPLSPIAVAPQAALPVPSTSPIAAPARNALIVPPQPSDDLTGSAGVPAGSVGGGPGGPAGDATAALADSLERLERWLAEHPQEALAEVTIRRPGASPDQQAITLGPDADMRPYVLQNLDDATTWQKEFSTGFLGRSLAAQIRAGSFPVLPTGAGEAGVQMRLEEGDGFQQEVSISGDPKTGAVTTRERRIRFTTDGTFRTLNRTLCKDFREVATGIWLPHRIDIDSFDIDPDKPENVIPRKACSVSVVVKEWRPQGGTPPAEADVPTPAAEAASGVTPPMDVSGDLESPFGKMKTDLVDALDRIDRWLAEHPQEAVADVTVRHAGDQVSERMTIGPGRRFPSDYTVNWDQKEFTTGFVGRSLAEVIRAGGRPAPPTHAATEIGVQTRLEDGDGFQQEVYISGDPKTGAVTTKELRGRATLDGAFRTVVRTRADDFREVAPGIRLPHRIDIDTFDIDPNQPENAIPKMANALTIVVEEWRPLAATAPAEDNPLNGESPTEASPEVRAESADPAR